MSPHLLDHEIEMFRDGRFDAAQLLQFAHHFNECAECRAKALRSIDLQREVEKTAQWLDRVEPFAHPSHEELVLYADQRLARAESEIVEEHLDDCRRCREDVGDLRDLRSEAPRARLAWAVAAAAIVACVVLTLWSIRRSSSVDRTPAPQISSARRSPSLAILPLRNASLLQDDGFLSVGIADALTTRLQQNPALYVRPMTAVLAMNDLSNDSRSSAARLAVDQVIEGRFTSASDSVNVQLQLIDVRSGRAVWSESINGPRGNLLQLVDAVSLRTTQHVGGVDAEISEARSSSPAAYETYLRARSLHAGVVPERFRAYRAALERTIELDPKFAAAHADLSIALTMGRSQGFVNDADAIELAGRHAREAVRLDPNLPSAHIALGRVLSRQPDHYREATSEILRALSLGSNDTSALQPIVRYFRAIGDVERARCLGNRIVRIDPTSDEARTRGYWDLASSDPSSALLNAQWALADDSTAMSGHDIRGQAFVLLGEMSSAEREARVMLDLAPHHYVGNSLMAMAAADRHDRAQTEMWLKKFETEASRNHYAAFRVALCYARLGDRKEALRWIALTLALGDHNLVSFDHPWLASLKAEPPFRAGMKRIREDLEAVHAEMMRAYPMICPEGQPRDMRSAS